MSTSTLHGLRMAIGLGLGLSTLALAEGPKLSVTVTGVQEHAGSVRCLVFTAAEGFPATVAKARFRAMVAASGPRVTCAFDGVPEGRFAVSVVHDTNDNDRLDTTFLGVPTEAYAFSHDARPGLFGPPSFDAAALEPSAAERPIELHLIYP